MFSKACQYAIKAILLIASEARADKKSTLNFIAYSINSPVSYTSKILQKLVKSNLIESVKGLNGGFKIELQKLEEIKLIDIIISIDGIEFFERCGMGLKYCDNEKPCIVHHHYAGIRENLRIISEKTLIKVMVVSLENGESVLKIK
jgi:Rrf2 family transcriptional regulator, iron-sulfur cluster assembly transcription factor